MFEVDSGITYSRISQSKPGYSDQLLEKFIFAQLKVVSQKYHFLPTLGKLCFSYSQISQTEASVKLFSLCVCLVCALQLIQKQISPQHGKVRNGCVVYPSL